MKFTTRSILFLLVMLSFTAVTLTARAAQYHPVLIARGLWTEEGKTGVAILWGGYAENDWKNLSDLPLKVQGHTMAVGDCPEFEGDNHTVETPLLRPGQKLDIYAARDGSQVGSSTVESMSFICFQASGQWELSVTVKNDQEPPESSFEEAFVLIDAGEKINFPGTGIEAEGPEVLSFLADSAPYGAVELRFKKEYINEIDDHLFLAEQIRNGEKSHFGQASVESADAISGFFVDFKADNNLEFVYFFDGPAGSEGIKTLSKPGHENDLIIIDTGE